MTAKAFVSPDFSSAEAQRLWYLKQLGIDACVPRFVLPGALPSQACELPRQAESAQPVQTVSPTPAARITQEPALRKTLFEEEAPAGRERLRQPPPASPVSAPAPPAAARTATQADDSPAVLPFRMVLLRAERGLVICSQVPMQNREGLNRQETRLLQNILTWLGTALLPDRQRYFAWPPPGMEGHAQAASGDLAGSSLFGFLEQAQRESRFSRLLLLGSSGFSALQRHVSSGHPALPWQQFHSHSLGEMLVNPELKREAWQAMLPLHNLLQVD